MAITGDLYKAILEKSGRSPATISRWAKRLNDEHGPMTPDEARLVIAHDLGIDLKKYGVSAEQRDRVRTLRAAGASLASVQQRAEPPQRRVRAKQEVVQPTPRQSGRMTPAALFTSRSFHTAVGRSSHKLFVGGHNKQAVHAAVQAVNNRVKRLSGLDEEDGQTLMGKAFARKNPALQMSSLATQSERDEHEGTRLIMMGAVTGLRNPRAHEDHWEPDEDIHSVLDCLAFASLLHRFLDRCEAYRRRNPRPSS